MHFLTREQYNITDRYFNLEVLVGEYTHNIDCLAYVLAEDSVLHSEGLEAKGTFSFCSGFGGFKVTGNALTIVDRGRRSDQVKFCTVAAHTPGDLVYIDGCSNTNLISPGRNGEACTNYLFFPRNTVQSEHVHPSFRIGMVLSGNGTAVVNGEQLQLKRGDLFFLPRFEKHYFCTGDSEMSLMVFHPDSDAGPTDELNPMKVRTYQR